MFSLLRSGHLIIFALNSEVMVFDLTGECRGSRARAGVLHTAHGKVETPVFMPVGTAGSVKGIHPRDLSDDIGASIILGNTYHLYLRPGTAVLQAAGGLHRFNGWSGPILTDSGGFQVFSLGELRKLTPGGVRFQSHIDGSYHWFTPESVIDIQRVIGADIVMAFDECTPGDADLAYAEKSLDLTRAWLDRCFIQFRATTPAYGYEQELFPVIQGATFPHLRKMAAAHAVGFDAAGYAIGGLATGEPEKVMYEMVETVTELLPAGKPRYLMGVGTPVNLLEAIDRGVDMFDCVMPTRNGRNGMLFTSRGILNIRNNKWQNDHTPVDPEGGSFVDHHYTRAFLRHLVISKEMLGAQIASHHNLAFYCRLMAEARRQILQGSFKPWKEEMITRLNTRL